MRAMVLLQTVLPILDEHFPYVMCNGYDWIFPNSIRFHNEPKYKYLTCLSSEVFHNWAQFGNTTILSCSDLSQ